MNALLHKSYWKHAVCYLGHDSVTSIAWYKALMFCFVHHFMKY